MDDFYISDNHNQIFTHEQIFQKRKIWELAALERVFVNFALKKNKIYRSLRKTDNQVYFNNTERNKHYLYITIDYIEFKINIGDFLLPVLDVLKPSVPLF